MISVLCVDDDAAHLSLEKRCLEEPGALTVTTALSAPEALRTMETSRFDAVVADYQMPGMDGIELLKTVRAANPGLPFIIFTGKGKEEVVIEAFNDGVDFYLQKNGDPKVLFARLKDTIKKAVNLGVVWKAFHDSELRYRRLFETAQDGILILDAESGAIMDANPFILTLIGYTRDEMLGKKLWEIGFIRDKALAEQAAADLKRTGYIRYEDLPLETKDGRAIDVEFVSNVYDVGNKNIAQCNIRDITDRRRAEEMRSHLAAIVENSDAAIIGITLDGIITSWNTGAERIYGYSAQEVVGRNISLLVPPDLPDDTRASLDQIRNGISIIRHETLHRKKDGVLINIAQIISPIKDSQNCLIGVSTIAQDITERKRGEDALRETKDYLENLIRYANVPIISWNPELKITEFNRAFEQLNGMTKEEVIGQPLTILFPDKTRDKSMDLIRRALRGEHWETVELPIRHVSGETRILLWNSANILDPTGKVMATIAQGRDITERKAAEEAIRTIGEDLERKVAERTSDLSDINLDLITEIEIRLDAEKQLNKTVGEKDVLLREVHHRVKNNLQIIISLLNLQSRYITDETTRSAFRECQSRVRAMALVHEKLYQSTDLTKLDLNNYLKFLGDNLFQFLGMKGKGITLTMDIRDIFLAIDTAIPVGLMINELISNSLKHAFPDGRKGNITLVIQREDHTLTILFQDNGVGIAEGFDWRNAESLGLRLVISLVEQLQGTIELDRKTGTMFTIFVKEKE
ncbi:MAG: PAS domain S-box protein [Methanoregula sp.]|jgi:PAS domain S-box-containing protein|nr:PAS domain S-box protein [Methanoregula sp.]